MLDNAAQSFETDDGDTGGASDREDVLLKKIGELTMERESTGLTIPMAAAVLTPSGTRRRGGSRALAVSL